MASIPQGNVEKVVPLGQAGFRFSFGSITVYIDPYLSNSVETKEGADFRRRVPIWKQPAAIDDADYVLITHAHIDHCDIDTLVPLARASAQCRFVGPQEVGSLLASHGIGVSRFLVARNEWLSLGADLRVHPLPAAHPEIEIDAQGNSRHVGYIIEYRKKRIYHSGDTLVNEDVISAVSSFKPIDVAILPVNERNYYREARGIVGNMSVREAFRFAADIQANTLIPMHWDVFEPNSVYPEEIETLYRLAHPPFRLLLRPTEL